jgi:hypothetical protein
VSAGRLLVNACVHADPDALAALVAGSVDAVVARHGVTARPERSAPFRPGRAVPTHRLGA